MVGGGDGRSRGGGGVGAARRARRGLRLWLRQRLAVRHGVRRRRRLRGQEGIRVAAHPHRVQHHQHPPEVVPPQQRSVVVGRQGICSSKPTPTARSPSPALCCPQSAADERANHRLNMSCVLPPTLEGGRGSRQRRRSRSESSHRRKWRRAVAGAHQITQGAGAQAHSGSSSSQLPGEIRDPARAGRQADETILVVAERNAAPQPQRSGTLSLSHLSRTRPSSSSLSRSSRPCLPWCPWLPGWTVERERAVVVE